AIEHHKNFTITFSLITSSHLRYKERSRASRRVRTLKLLLFKKYERSEYIINAFDFAFERTRAKRVP
ncbi:hypothetical protein, partial [Acinetobacter gerneri]|uniref:hypothetical protein n=1 Tax=Acinetobacter gerneri TaxID=202952 RepID=UPI001BB2D832